MKGRICVSSVFLVIIFRRKSGPWPNHKGLMGSLRTTWFVRAIFSTSSAFRVPLDQSGCLAVMLFGLIDVFL